MRHIVTVACCTTLIACGFGLARAQEIRVATPVALAGALVQAKPGSTLVLAAGTYGPVQLPAGVSLRGAGIGKTVIDGGAAAAAIAIAGGKGSTVEDLSVVTRGTAGIEARGTAGLTLRRVTVRGGAMGLRLVDVAGGRVENSVIDQSLTGVSLAQVRKWALVNCTVYRCNSVGISLLDVTESAVFNNVVAEAGIGILVNGRRDGLAVDHNLYLALFVGRVEGQLTRVSLGTWHEVTGGYDAASVQLAVSFADPDKSDYRPMTALEWAPWQATTSDWGVPELAGFKAPAKDLRGAARQGALDVGAVESGPLAEVRAEAQFKVAADAGTKSAGLFTKDGTAVRYLFQGLPLKKGTYGFALPTRSTLGAEIAAGDYEVRVAEGNLKWAYRGMIANNGVSNAELDADFDSTVRVAFAADGALLLGNGWNERAMNLVKRDVTTRKGQWAFRGSANNQGLAVAGDGSILLLREAKDGYTLSRLDAGTGKPMDWGPARPFVFLASATARLEGLAELDGKLYLADTTGKLFITSLADPKLDRAVDLLAARLPVADRVHKLVWLLTGTDKVVAVDAEGQVRQEVTSVPQPVGVATNGARLAVASYAAGKVFYFALGLGAGTQPEAIGSIGRGDGPYGPILADRFWFQQGPYNSAWRVPMDLDAQGRLVVCDRGGRVLVFDTNGKSLYQSFAQFGNAPYQAYFEDNGDRARFFDNSGSYTWWVDAKAGSWTPDAYWGKPPLNQPGGNAPVQFFGIGERKFGAFFSRRLDATGKGGQDGILIVRYEQCVGKPVAFYGPGQGGWRVVRDGNGDGTIDRQDGDGEPVLDVSGKPVTRALSGRWVCGERDGSLRNGSDQLWKLKGVDANGYPVFEFPAAPVLAFQVAQVPSPYDFAKKANLNSQSESQTAADGDLLISVQGVEAAPNGMGLSNSGALDLVRCRPDGSLRWYLPLNDFGPVQGVKAVTPGFILTSWGHQTEWIGLDDNGLVLGHLGFPAAAEWGGYWVDHPQQYRMYQGNDGRLQVTVGEYVRTCHHWFTLENYDNGRKAAFPVKIDAATAKALAARPAATVQALAKPAQPRITIARLKAPLPIDGDLVKWRQAGITPQIVATPVTASAAIQGPADASGIIRLAYEGNNLYVQVLRFDNVVTFHQTTEATHLQDTVEMMLNGFFPAGFQFSVSNFLVDGKLSPEMVRRRFFFQGNKAYLVPAEHAPRVVKVLDDARAVEERQLIESVYGVDMSACKVIVTEFKLPIDKVTWKDSEETLFAVGPGKTVWIGFMLDDNDVPGTDVQNLIVWPASYSTFDVKEKGALATFE